MAWSGGGYCVATLEQAARLECLITSSPCGQDGARILGYHRPTGKAYFAIPSADPAHPFTVDYIQVNACANPTQGPVTVSTQSGSVLVGLASRWGADVETSAYCAVSPDASSPDYLQVGEFFAVGFFVVLSLYCSAVGLGAVMRIVRQAYRV